MITKKYLHLAYLIIFLIKSELKYRCDYHTSSQVQTQKKKKSEYYTVYFSQFLWLYLSLFDFFNRESNIKKCQREEVKCGQCVWKVACGITVFSILQFFSFFKSENPYIFLFGLFKKNIYT